MSRIYWDTMLFAYGLESHPEFGPQVEALLDRMQTRGDSLSTSVFTLAELLVKPLASGNQALAGRIQAEIAPPQVAIIPFDTVAARQFAAIRAQFHVAPPDAIHLASAAVARTDLFLTCDRTLLRLNIPGIGFIATPDTVAPLGQSR